MCTSEIAPRAARGAGSGFAHGYNIHFGLIRPPQTVDVIMVAPRMIGINVRAASSTAAAYPPTSPWRTTRRAGAHIALAWAKGIGATRAGVLETTFAQETELDLFAEQGVWPIIMRDLLLSFEVLVEAGFPPEMVALELYGSGEAARSSTRWRAWGSSNRCGCTRTPASTARCRAARACCPTRRAIACGRRCGDSLRQLRAEWGRSSRRLPTFEALRQQPRAPTTSIGPRCWDATPATLSGLRSDE